MGDADNNRRGKAAERRSNHARTVILLASVVVLGFGLFLAYRLGWWDAVRASFSSVEAMRGFVAGFGAWAPAVFFLAQVAQVLLAPIPGGVTVVVGTLLFGVWGGLALSVAGAAVGSALLFLAVRRWGRPLAVRLVGEESFEKYVGALDERGTLLFVIMLVPSCRTTWSRGSPGSPRSPCAVSFCSSPSAARPVGPLPPSSPRIW